MKVSFYELLGMIKENKQPKKVIYDDVVYMWTKNGYEKKDVIMPSLIVVENKSLRCKINDNKMFDKNITILESSDETKEETNKFTKEDFIKERMNLDGITIEQFNKRYEVKECNCGMPYCRGFIAEEKAVEDNKIELLDIHKEKNCKNNWKWKCNGYNISTPQKIIGEKLNEVIDKLNKMEENK